MARSSRVNALGTDSGARVTNLHHNIEHKAQRASKAKSCKD